MSRVAAGIAAALALAAAAAAAAPVERDALFRTMGLKAGQWRSTFTVTIVEAVPEEPADRAIARQLRDLRGQLGRALTIDECVPERDPGGGLILPGAKVGRDCRYERIDAENGRLEIVAICGSADSAMLIRAGLQSNYSPAQMDSVFDTIVTHNTTGDRIRLVATASSRHTGPCGPPVGVVPNPEDGR